MESAFQIYDDDNDDNANDDDNDCIYLHNPLVITGFIINFLISHKLSRNHKNVLKYVQ